MAIWLERLALDRWRHNEGCDRGKGADAHPLALISETAHGPRIDAVNGAGRAAGACEGMRLADARGLCPQLKAVPSDTAGDLDCLEKLALWSQRWGPWSAVDLPDGMIVDITGVAHLFGGETGLLNDASMRLDRRGWTARLAVAPTAGAAWALAHYGPSGAILGPEDDAEMRLADLPVAALRLDDDVLVVLRRLGLKRLGDLYGVGRDALRRRFRNRLSPMANPLLRMDQLLGRVPEPRQPVASIIPPTMQRRLLEPLRHRELLDRVVADLAAAMARELEARAEGARRLDLGLWRVDGAVLVRQLEMAAATRDPEHICRLFAARLEDVEAGFGIEMVQLQAVWTQPLALGQKDFEAGAEKHGTSLSACLDRLTVRLGKQAVCRPVIRASHVPERAQAWRPPLELEPVLQPEPVFYARPLKLLDRPEAIAVLYASPDGYPQRFRWRGDVHEVIRVEGPERVAPEWWRERSSTRLRDYYRIEDREGRRYWIYREGMAGDGRGGAPAWFLQGICA